MRRSGANGRASHAEGRTAAGAARWVSVAVEVGRAQLTSKAALRRIIWS